MLLAIVPEKRIASCRTIPICDRSDDRVTARTSSPSMVTDPDDTS